MQYVAHEPKAGAATRVTCPRPPIAMAISGTSDSSAASEVAYISSVTSDAEAGMTASLATDAPAFAIAANTARTSSAGSARSK